MKKITFLVVFMVLGLSQHLFSQAQYDRSITLSASGVYVYADDFGGLSPGYGAMLTYNYHLSDDYLLGLNLLRYELHPGDNPGFMSFAYGFTFQHFWKKDWGDTGIWGPYMSYSILLNQGIQSGVTGRAMAHNTRMALGTEIRLGEGQRLGIEGLWNYVTYTFFGEEPLGYQNLGLGLSYRFLF